MPDNRRRRNAIHKVWIAFRFIVFGVGGFLLLMVCWFTLIEQFFTPGEELRRLVALPLMLAGATMMLFGVGEWGRWGYLWVFLSMPLGIYLLILLPPPYSGNEGLGVLVFSLPLVVTYVIVRRYYRRKGAQQEDRGSLEVPPIPSAPADGRE